MERKMSDWDNVLDALKEEYTISFRDICKMLKVSRSWVNRYIKPNVDAIYLSNGKAGGVPWTSVASVQLGRLLNNESIWFSKNQFVTLFKESVSSVTKQTKVVPYTYFMGKNADEYICEFNFLENELNDKIKKRFPEDEIQKVYDKMMSCHKKYIPENVYRMVEDGKANEYKRGETMHVTVDLPDISNYRRQLIAVHDIKDYGDTDEMIYRALFSKGAIRIVLSIPDKLGILSEKIYYIEDPSPLMSQGGLNILMKESTWKTLK